MASVAKKLGIKVFLYVIPLLLYTYSLYFIDLIELSYLRLPETNNSDITEK